MPQSPKLYKLVLSVPTMPTIRWCNGASPEVLRKKHLFPKGLLKKKKIYIYTILVLYYTILVLYYTILVLYYTILVLHYTILVL